MGGKPLSDVERNPRSAVASVMSLDYHADITCRAALRAMYPHCDEVLLVRALRWCNVPPQGAAMLWASDLQRVSTVIIQWAGTAVADS